MELQLFRHDDFVRKAKSQQERTVKLSPRRGAITDAEGRPLAVTTLAESVFALRSEIRDADEVSRTLAPLVKKPASELRARLADGDGGFVWLARGLSAEAARRVRATRLPGVRLVAEPARRYPQGTLAASVLGFVGDDNQGLAGLEHRYDDEVRGRPARLTLLRDAAQRSYGAADAESEKARALVDAGVEGVSLGLTLDAAIQHVAERELRAAVAAWRARAGSAVVMEPKTGAILALASFPTFDPNRFKETSRDLHRCRPVTDTYEPGSTFKVVAAAAALEEGTVSPDELINCGGGEWKIAGRTIHEHGRNRYGVLSLGDVLAHSSNIGIARVAWDLGKGPYYRYVRAFGFGQKTGVDLGGESVGLLADVSSWTLPTLPTMAFGQEIAVTVLQMTRAYAAIANGGLLPTPHVVAEVRRGDVVESRRPHPGPRVVSERTAETLRRLLTKVVETGTGRLAAIPGFAVAGKTGTAQKAAPGGGYAHDLFVASFFGLAPAESPRVVIGVMLDEPQEKIYGGDVAAPVFAAIGAETLRLLGEPAAPAPGRLVPPVLVADLSAGAALGGPVLSSDLVPAAQRLSEETASAKEPTAEGLSAARAELVPDVIGLSARDAVARLSGSGWDVRLFGHGFVAAQEPPPGAPAERRGTLRLSLSAELPRRSARLAAGGV